MKHQRMLISLAVLAALVLLSLAPAVQSAASIAGGLTIAPGAGYELSWYSIDGGGGMFSTGGGYSLGGTIGQPDAGTLSGGSYALQGGFWSGGANAYKVFLPLVMKGL